VIRLPESVLKQIQREAESAYPNEGCGVLVGAFVEDIRQVHQAIACVNTRTDSPQDRYGIEPRDLVRIQRRARDSGWEIVGFYHSHPDHPARWSATDLAEAHWIGCSYLITRVEAGIARETNSFLLQGTQEEDKHFEDEPLQATA
jgi:proteasome lid subunit RPN8/RPN11